MRRGKRPDAPPTSGRLECVEENSISLVGGDGVVDRGIGSRSRSELAGTVVPLGKSGNRGNRLGRKQAKQARLAREVERLLQDKGNGYCSVFGLVKWGKFSKEHPWLPCIIVNPKLMGGSISHLELAKAALQSKRESFVVYWLGYKTISRLNTSGMSDFDITTVAGGDGVDFASTPNDESSLSARNVAFIEATLADAARYMEQASNEVIDALVQSSNAVKGGIGGISVADSEEDGESSGTGAHGKRVSSLGVHDFNVPGLIATRGTGDDFLEPDFNTLASPLAVLPSVRSSEDGSSKHAVLANRLGHVSNDGTINKSGGEDDGCANNSEKEDGNESSSLSNEEDIEESESEAYRPEQGLLYQKKKNKTAGKGKAKTIEVKAKTKSEAAAGKKRKSGNAKIGQPTAKKNKKSCSSISSSAIAASAASAKEPQYRRQPTVAETVEKAIRYKLKLEKLVNPSSQIKDEKERSVFIINLLERLGRLQMTAAILTETQIGSVVIALRKYPNEKIAIHAKAVRNLWKEQLSSQEDRL